MKGLDILELPQSWIRSASNSPQIHSVKLTNHKSLWFSTAEIPTCNNLIEILESHHLFRKVNIIIRGCNEELSGLLAQKGFEKIIAGKEAVLEFDKDHFSKKSLKELIRRGKRHGRVTEIPFSPENSEKLEKFKQKSPHSKEPQLKHFFVDRFLENTRLFVFTGEENTWHGAIVISVNSRDKLQTELLLRSIDAPIGIMEALVYGVFEKLKDSGYREWGLGEVPFLVDSGELDCFSKAFLINKIGQLIKFAYNYKGLFHFKNKFNPRWDNAFICAKPNLRLCHLFFLAIKSNLLHLIIYKFTLIARYSIITFRK